MTRIVCAFVFIVFFPLVSEAQLSISNGKHLLEISGTVSSYYNYRSLKDGMMEKDKDRFNVRDAQLMIEGRNRDIYEYRIQMDFADLLQGGNDPENPGLMDAWFKYKGFQAFTIQFGYGKIQYSRSSLVPISYSAWWQRPEMARGNFFSRRDIGLTLSRSFWRRRIELSAGAYTGLGETSVRAGDNDDSGKLEYVGRAEFCWPSYYRNRDIDTRHVPVPMLMAGFNGRYANKQLPTGSYFPNGSQGDYGFKTVDGEKLTYGMDLSAQWQGFSAQFELQQVKATPSDTNSPFLKGYSREQTKGYFLAGGWSGQAAYYSKKLKTIVSARYEEFNLNDLVAGINQRASFAVCYQLDGFNSIIKLQVIHIIKEESLAPLDWKQQVRIGWQCMF